jgi:hypothetical protein
MKFWEVIAVLGRPLFVRPSLAAVQIDDWADGQWPQCEFIGAGYISVARLIGVGLLDVVDHEHLNRRSPRIQL